jgi:hypothetical protein
MKIDVKHKDAEGNDVDNSMTVFVLQSVVFAILFFLQILGVYFIWNNVVVDVITSVKEIDMIQAIALLALVNIFRIRI